MSKLSLGLTEKKAYRRQVSVERGRRRARGALAERPPGGGPAGSFRPDRQPPPEERLYGTRRS